MLTLAGEQSAGPDGGRHPLGRLGESRQTPRSRTWTTMVISVRGACPGIMKAQHSLYSKRDICNFFGHGSCQGLSGLNASWQPPRLAEAFRELREAAGEQGLST